MSQLEIIPDTQAHVARGDFGARLEHEQLLVPPEVNAVLARHGLVTAEDFVSFIHSFPSALATDLGWRAEDVLHARELLVVLLRGVMRAEILSPPEPPARAYGALRPPGAR